MVVDSLRDVLTNYLPKFSKALYTIPVLDVTLEQAGLTD